MTEIQNNIISIVIPIYKGKQYINNILQMYDENVSSLENAGYNGSVELVLINDYPDEKIEVEHQGVRVINSKANNGIQASRVIGINVCEGQYVLMLDQDDRIASDFILSQIEKIGTADLIICNGTHNDWPIFQSADDFRSKMNDIGINYIISPGQALIKKTSIPEVWKEDIMSCGGADDYYLWILMTNNGAVFEYNNDVLFEHVKHEGNTSNDMLVMKASNEELLQKIEKYIDNGKYKEQLVSGIRKTIDENDKQMRIEKVFDRIAADKSFINSQLEANGCDRILIYGFGNMGQRTYHLLKESGVEIKCVLDKKEPSESMKREYNIMYPSEENLGEVGENELVIVTPIQQSEEIKKILIDNKVKNVISMVELAKQMES